ncbi:hypothetical protein IQ250_29990, partial [Pseudanabaenaceae cyanobacterium LEGE 13415]|nr:hypothetical protein [Pseudanabaenaceae cyanobacterium LEGE 13415]
MKNAAGRRIAECIFQSGKLLNFTGLTDDAIVTEQKRIVAGLVDAFTFNKITYRLNRESPSLLKFQVRLLSSDRLTVPLDQPAETATLELLSLDAFTIREQPDLEIVENGCPDVMTLYGLLKDIPESYVTEQQLKFGIGNPIAVQALEASELSRLIEAYQQQLEQLVSLQLFDRFAEKHPGMEPLGGVPKGGTFILVYVDGQDARSLLNEEIIPEIYQSQMARFEAIQAVVSFPPASSENEVISSLDLLRRTISDRKDIVIADFCLPYRSNNQASAVSYVLARPRPIVLLEKMVFCEGDTHSYRFILEPEGGTVKGEGVVFDGHQHVFQPSRIDASSLDKLSQGHEVTVTFSYSVDDTYDTLTITIYPKPNPTLTVQPRQNFCQNAAPIEIKLAPDTPTELELVQVTINGTVTTILDPSQY